MAICLWHTYTHSCLDKLCLCIHNSTASCMLIDSPHVVKVPLLVSHYKLPTVGVNGKVCLRYIYTHCHPWFVKLCLHCGIRLHVDRPQRSRFSSDDFAVVALPNTKSDVYQHICLSLNIAGQMRSTSVEEYRYFSNSRSKIIKMCKGHWWQCVLKTSAIAVSYTHLTLPTNREV